MMYPLVRELAARGAPIRVPVTVEYDKPIWPHCAAAKSGERRNT